MARHLRVRVAGELGHIRALLSPQGGEASTLIFSPRQFLNPHLL